MSASVNNIAKNIYFGGFSNRRNADLGENALEIEVVRGINFSVSGTSAKDLDTHVKFDFPYPSDQHQSDRTSTVRSTSDPSFNAKFSLTINRKSRSVARIFKRQGITCEVYQKGLVCIPRRNCRRDLPVVYLHFLMLFSGFLRSDRLIGKAEIKLQALETKCEHHGTFDLLDSHKRRPVGGQLEVRIRMREPLLGTHVEQFREKWLAIDQFMRAGSGAASPLSPTRSGLPSVGGADAV